MATIRQRGGSYRVEWKRGGRGGHAEGVTMPTDKLAIQAKTIAEARRHDITTNEMYDLFGIQGPEANSGDSPTYAEFAKEWLQSLMSVSERTRKDYAGILDTHIIPAIGSVRVQDIDHDMVKRLIAKVAGEASAKTGRKRKPATVIKMHAVLFSSLEAAVPRRLPTNPCRAPGPKKKRGLPKVKPFEATFLTKEEARMISDHAHPAAQDLIDMLFGTSARVSELMELECRNVRLPSAPIGPLPRGEGQPFIYVPDAKSENGVRMVTISRRLAERIRPLVEGRRPTDLVFTTPTGKRWDINNFRSKYWYRAVASASRCLDHMPPLKIVKRGPDRLDPMSVSTCACPGRLHKWPRVHDARHTGVDWLIEAGWDFDKIRARVGHDDIETTIKLYGKRNRQGDETDLQALDY